MSLQLPVLTQAESDARYDYLQRHSIAPVTLFTNGNFNFSTATPYVTQQYTLTNYSGLAFVASNLFSSLFDSVHSVYVPLQVQLSLNSTPLTADGLMDQGNILFTTFGISGRVTPDNTSFAYVYQDWEPLFIPLQTNVVLYLHFIAYTSVNLVSQSVVHRMVLGLIQTGLKI